MTYEDIRSFSISLGDAIAIKEFCKSKAEPTKRESLIEKLKRKIEGRTKSSTKVSSEDSPCTSNTTETRKEYTPQKKKENLHG